MAICCCPSLDRRQTPRKLYWQRLEESSMHTLLLFCDRKISSTSPDLSMYIDNIGDMKITNFWSKELHLKSWKLCGSALKIWMDSLQRLFDVSLRAGYEVRCSSQPDFIDSLLCFAHCGFYHLSCAPGRLSLWLRAGSKAVCHAEHDILSVIHWNYYQHWMQQSVWLR